MTMPDPTITPEEAIRRLTAILAETHPKWTLSYKGNDSMKNLPVVMINYGSDQIPVENRTAVLHRAFKLAGYPVACWSCTNESHEVERGCIAGECSHPDEPWEPPRELLI